jgi:sugar O-acyltransferase (sialic acid O-acetyltransferase NeuD family)
MDVVNAINRVSPAWTVVGFLDDTRVAGSLHLGLPILGPLWSASKHSRATFINAIGSDTSYSCRPELLAGTGLAVGRFATLIHPLASVSSRARVGRGVCINFGVSVGGGTIIGNHATLHPSCTIGHDANVDDYAIVAPGAIVSGYVYVGKSSYVGAGASIRQWVRIGERSLVGMGAVVLKDVPTGRTVVGNPARTLMPNSKEAVR